MYLCETCKKECHTQYASGRYCSNACACKRGDALNRQKINEKTRNTLKNKPPHIVHCAKCGEETLSKCTNHNQKIYCKKCKIVLNRNRYFCSRCGAIKGQCKYPKLCKKNISLFNNLEKYFGFNKQCIGSEKYYEELFRIKFLLENDYINNEISIPELALKYNHHNFGNFSKLLKSLDISFRSLKEAVHIVYKLGKNGLCVNPTYKHGWHTTWNNTKVFYRSSYELDFAKELDSKKIVYTLESMRIVYFDSIKCRNRVAIPDFYLPDINTIIEIKSKYTYNELNMKDKIVQYKKQGYNVQVILDHKLIIDC